MSLKQKIVARKHSSQTASTDAKPQRLLPATPTSSSPVKAEDEEDPILMAAARSLLLRKSSSSDHPPMKDTQSVYQHQYPEELHMPLLFNNPLGIGDGDPPMEEERRSHDDLIDDCPFASSMEMKPVCQSSRSRS